MICLHSVSAQELPTLLYVRDGEKKTKGKEKHAIKPFFMNTAGQADSLEKY